MEKLNIEAILEKNPQIDRKSVEEKMKKVSEEGYPTRRGKSGSASPYASRRFFFDTKEKSEDLVDPQYRSHFGKR
ncbi:hypothetical protein GBZ48_21455 [Azospirillum melinis]|uniref:Uncharacterized protein n=1 Tax=Azospirillum melinis TaxID=328839 RepID=A0ABX2KPP9_9PROT|nr:hypothetical protein [Azospirillum melinis]MBP2309418.1 hypothetical protein [Azospirillum melinis]NUB01824.1 hypothetical protein [Azospirillum melinis]